MENKKTPCELVGEATKTAVQEVLIRYKKTVEYLKHWCSRICEYCSVCGDEKDGESASGADTVPEKEPVEELSVSSAEEKTKIKKILTKEKQEMPEKKKEEIKTENVKRKKYAFKYHDARAKQVELAADFTDWKKIPMERKKDGTWLASVEMEAGKHGYKFIVDGQWIVDPKNPRTQPDAFGGKSSVFEVTE